MPNATTPQPPIPTFTRTADTATKALIREDRIVEAAGSDGEPVEPRLARIARRAHELYEARGGQDGRDLEDWLQAEREIDAETDHEREARE